ncbi:hypothetical protein HZA98_00620 [Candidatus Woesearchaeota archaeon]|nr:hypothetical protein [Candidatus Woesearchaeota archaeon]
MTRTELVELDLKDRKKALELLGYSISTDGFVLDENFKEVICKYTKEKVHIKYAAILPGSLLIINATPLSMANYFLDYPEDEQ